LAVGHQNKSSERNFNKAVTIIDDDGLFVDKIVVDEKRHRLGDVFGRANAPTAAYIEAPANGFCVTAPKNKVIEPLLSI